MNWDSVFGRAMTWESGISRALDWDIGIETALAIGAAISLLWAVLFFVPLGLRALRDFVTG